MAGLDDPTVVLRGGSRDGESTTLAPEVRRLLAASDAPGLADVYEATDEVVHLRGNEEPATVFRFVGQEPLGDMEPSMIHMPSKQT